MIPDPILISETGQKTLDDPDDHKDSLDLMIDIH
jgi:hypothetical protein